MPRCYLQAQLMFQLNWLLSLESGEGWEQTGGLAAAGLRCGGRERGTAAGARGLTASRADALLHRPGRAAANPPGTLMNFPFLPAAPSQSPAPALRSAEPTPRWKSCYCTALGFIITI